MRAAIRARYGPPEVVRLDEIDRPTPTADQVLVRVKAASVNRADLDGLYPRWAFIRLFIGLRAPREGYRRPGIDVAGVVEAIGPDVKELKVGDNVFSDLSAFGQGSFADYVCVPERALALMPPNLTHEDAATLPHSGVLAARAFARRGGREFQPAMRALIVGASGNVGPFAIQIAKSLGAHVTGVASGDKLDFVRSLGADDVIDYKTTDYTRPAEPYDWIVDVSAHHPLRRWRAALKRGGVYLSYGGSAWWLLSSAIGGPLISGLTGRHLGVAFVSPFGAKDVARVKELVAEGVLKPVIDRRYPLDQVVEALRWVDDGKPRGKVLIVP